MFAALIALAAQPHTLAEPRRPTARCLHPPDFDDDAGRRDLLSRAQPNWAAPAYVSATVLVTGWALQRGWRRAMAISIEINTAAAVAIFAGYPTLTALRKSNPRRSTNPLQRLRGWHELGQVVGKELGRHRGFHAVRR